VIDPRTPWPLPRPKILRPSTSKHSPTFLGEHSKRRLHSTIAGVWSGFRYWKDLNPPFSMCDQGPWPHSTLPSVWLRSKCWRTSLHHSLCVIKDQDLTPPFLVCDHGLPPRGTLSTLPIEHFGPLGPIITKGRIPNRVADISTLPLNEWGNLHESQLASGVQKFISPQLLCQKISYLLISGDVPKPDSSPLTMSHMYLYLISICLDLSWNTWFFESFTHLWLS